MNLIVQRGKAYEYRDDAGNQYFSVSQVRKVVLDSYTGVPSSQLEPARQRGETLHQFFALLLGSRAQVCEKPERIDGLEGYCQAIEEWAERNAVRPLLIEEPSVNREYGFAGTPDALVEYGPKKVVAIIDLKTGSPVPTESIQLLMYKKMEGYEKAKMLMDLYVDGSGRFKEVERKTDMAGWAVALSAINILRWRAAQ